MKSRTGQIISLALIIFFSGTFASVVLAESKATNSTEIYKWTDQDGRVHYAARPGDDTAKKMHLGSQIFHDQRKSNKTDGKSKQAAERAKICQDSKNTLQKYKKAPFLYRYDDQLKQKVRLTEEESKATMLQAEKDISYWCTPKQDS
ncbi:DUF4124 domain-containing protein [sulfur-oxidizing endosymbiont of Gigantopelta aegis]|uniref:DUF4124 domain-containing protein n=1 Tax=sulfur-oxidizing endosymbiont of Gigantopelta aegis TaxID=2794934 RepID=UPI0018DB5466|nr:DUF4124 domain-containing protein [sulfur-oxidizing endosymbiont of Gigantopelta aegis]